MTSKEADEVIRHLKNKYICTSVSKSGYIIGCTCVGGAICLDAKIATACNERLQQYFPSKYYVCDGLIKCNPSLDDNAANRFANDIVNANDRDHIDRAWEIVKEAFCYPNKPDEVIIPMDKDEFCLVLRLPKGE